MSEKYSNDTTGFEIAVIGMAGRFPGAKNLDEFWENLVNGIESISFFSDEELENSGIHSEMLQNPDYIKAKGVLEDIEYFDSLFFDYTPRESEILDPQIRIALECTWQALEDANYNPYSFNGLVGFYFGASDNLLWQSFPLLSSKNGPSVEFSNQQMANKDYLSLRVAYDLNLKGPAVTINTTCSTSLVAIDMACKSLLMGQCDLAIAGGISVNIPQKEGYLYQEGMVNSSDGHIRAFDLSANGTNGGDGVGIVILESLEDAVKNRDYIYAIIKGSAVNNDGKSKVGFTAPSVEGQEQVIRTALYMAQVEPESIGYIEAHGTGTSFGDPIEIEALKKAFNTEQKQFCGIGSVKTNIGHTDSAAGVAGFIKAVLSIKNRQIPPNLHFKVANSKIDFKKTPFFVVSQLTSWDNAQYPLRAGVSSFGIGGTNAHVIIEEAPIDNSVQTFSSKRDSHLIFLSAKSQSALNRNTENFVQFLKKNSDFDLADIAYSLALGRHVFSEKKVFVASNISDVINILSDPNSEKVYEGSTKTKNRPIIFMFSGQGQQYVNMGRGLYESEGVFHQEMDRCFSILNSLLEVDIKEILYPDNGPNFGESIIYEEGKIGSEVFIFQQNICQPVLFIIEYALAKLLISWGLTPYAMIGYSIGEYVAATLSGVFTLEEALKVVTLRGNLMQEIPGGKMISVPLSEGELKHLLSHFNGVVDIAVNNGSSCIVSGMGKDIQVFREYLKKERKLICMDLNISHAGHSRMMDPMMGRFSGILKEIPFKTPKMPYISTLTGQWISEEEAKDPIYWTRHLREAVQFNRGISELLKVEEAIFLEIGPGRSLSTSTLQNPQRKKGQPVFELLRHPDYKDSDLGFLLLRMARLCLYGKSIDWENFYNDELRRKIKLPVYSFDQYTYPVQHISETLKKIQMGDGGIFSNRSFEKETNISDWFYIPSWKPSIIKASPDQIAPFAVPENCWLVFTHSCMFSDLLLVELKKRFPDLDIIIVKLGTEFSENKSSEYTISPGKRSHYKKLMRAIKSGGKTVNVILHLWNISVEGMYSSEKEMIDVYQNIGYYSLIYLAQELGIQRINHDVKMVIFSDQMQGVPGVPLKFPEKSILLGPVRVIPSEYPNITCRSIDIVLPKPGSLEEKRLIAHLLDEITAEEDDIIVAYRGNQRLVQGFEKTKLEESQRVPIVLKENGVYFIPGGLGGIGLELAQYLAEAIKAKIILIGRTPLPAKEEWENWLLKHGDVDKTSQKIQKIQEMEKMGAEVMISNADVSNPQQMAVILDQVKDRFGEINGIIYCALHLDGAMIHLMTPEKTQHVFDSKIRGVLVLKKLLRQFKPDFFILCSSIGSIMGNPGEVAYCAANSFQDAFAYYMNDFEKNGEASLGYTKTINWDSWKEVGGAVEFLRQIYGFTSISNSDVVPVDHPLFISKKQTESNQMVFNTQLNALKNWVINEHRVMGIGTLPGTGYLELVVSAFENFTGFKQIEIQDFYLMQPLQVYDDAEREVQTIFKKNGDGYEFKILSLVNRIQNQWQEHAKGKIFECKLKGSKKNEIKKFDQICFRDDDIEDAPNEKNSHFNYTNFGLRWQNNIKSRKIGETQQLMKLGLSEDFLTDLEFYKLHPALLDCALAVPLGNGFYLPFSYRRIMFFESLPSVLYSYISYSNGYQPEAKTQSFNVLIMDEQGKELLKIEDYTLMKASGMSNSSDSMKVKNKETERLKADEIVKEQLKNSISPAEGIEVFKRILGTTLPQLFVSTQELKIRLQKNLNSNSTRDSDFLKTETEFAPIQPRPELSTKYIKPEAELEKNLVDILGTLLGIDKIGINDNFFDLGATSLTIMQFSNLVKDKLGMELPIVNFYIHPTARQLVRFINKDEHTGVLPMDEKNSINRKKNRRKVMQKRKLNIKGDQDVK